MSLLSLIIFGAISVYRFHVLAFLIASGCVNMIIQVYRAKFSCEMDNIFFFALQSWFCLHDFSLCDLEIGAQEILHYSWG